MQKLLNSKFNSKYSNRVIHYDKVWFIIYRLYLVFGGPWATFINAEGLLHIAVRDYSRDGLGDLT